MPHDVNGLLLRPARRPTRRPARLFFSFLFFFPFLGLKPWGKSSIICPTPHSIPLGYLEHQSSDRCAQTRSSSETRVAPSAPPSTSLVALREELKARTKGLVYEIKTGNLTEFSW